MKRKLLAHPRRTHFKFDQCVLQVHWVQCDKCELWYHLFCIGLKPHNIKEDEDFCCRYCITTTCQCDFTSLFCVAGIAKIQVEKLERLEAAATWTLTSMGRWTQAWTWPSMDLWTWPIRKIFHLALIRFSSSDLF